MGSFPRKRTIKGDNKVLISKQAFLKQLAFQFSGIERKKRLTIIMKGTLSREI